MCDYEKQANDFLAKTHTEIKIEFLKNDFHFDGDKEKRDIYEITLRRAGRKFTFNFGNSLNNSGFYYTVGRKITQIDRKFLDKTKTELLTHIKRDNSYQFLNNGKSDVIHYPTAPTSYDILACLTKYDPGTFEEFCSEFGYDTDSRKAKKTYKAVCKEWLNVCKIWDDAEIEQLSEIQ